MATRTIHSQLAPLIKTARGERTQEQLAAKFGVTRQLVYLWEHGLSLPSDEVLKALGIVRRYELKAKTK